MAYTFDHAKKETNYSELLFDSWVDLKCVNSVKTYLEKKVLCCRESPMSDTGPCLKIKSFQDLCICSVLNPLIFSVPEIVFVILVCAVIFECFLLCHMSTVITLKLAFGVYPKTGKWASLFSHSNL